MSPIKRGSTDVSFRVGSTAVSKIQRGASEMWIPGPKAFSGLAAWFDADDASTFTLGASNEVAEWRDKSGNGYAVSQSTVNNRPVRTGTLNGRACVDFDGTNDCLFVDDSALATLYSGDKSVMLFVVGEMQDSAEMLVNSQGTWVGWGSSTSGTPFHYIRSNASSGAGNLAIRNDASSQTGSIGTASGPAGDGTGTGNAKDFFIVSTESSSQSAAVYRTHTVMSAVGDGIGNRPISGAETTASSVRPAGNATVNRFSIGALGRNTFSDFFPGRIAEVLVYSRALTASERASVVAFLSRKYNNVAVPLL